MKVDIQGSHWSLSVDQRGEWVTMGIETADDKWRFTDAHGHEHYYDHGYPTLDYIIDAEHSCDGSEGWAHHDPHMVVDESHFECLTCREVIEPATHGPDHRVFIPGLIDVVLTGVRSDGMSVELWLTQDEYEAFAGDPEHADEHANRLLNETPFEQFKSITIASRQGSSPAPHDPSSEGGAGH